MGRALRRWVWVVVVAVAVPAWAQAAKEQPAWVQPPKPQPVKPPPAVTKPAPAPAEPGPHFGLYLAFEGGGTSPTANQVRTGGGAGLTAELGIHLAPNMALAVSGGGYYSLSNSMLNAALVLHHSFGQEFFSVGAGLGAFTLVGQETTALTVPFQFDLLPLFQRGARPLLGLGLRLTVAPGVDLGTGRFAMSGGLNLAMLVLD